ncbi:MAG TPA: hypothetical protein PKD85_10820 [Saprospiraceae bacterium]|nr:hypothetical protein [Saprospiraceae bacterium]
MPIKDLNNVIGVIFLIIPTLIWAVWSFKLYDVFQAKSFKSGADFDKIFEHDTNGILGSSVCPFGKFGAVFIICWSILLIILLVMVNILYWDVKNNEKLRVALQAIGWTNVAIMIIIAGLSGFMNPPLFIRTLPFYFLQIGISIMILNNIPPPINCD